MAANDLGRMMRDASAQLYTRDLMQLRWRVGRKLGRTIYADDGTDGGVFLGLMDTSQLATHVVSDHNLAIEREQELRRSNA